MYHAHLRTFRLATFWGRIVKKRIDCWIAVLVEILEIALDLRDLFVKLALDEGLFPAVLQDSGEEGVALVLYVGLLVLQSGGGGVSRVLGFALHASTIVVQNILRGLNGRLQVSTIRSLLVILPVHAMLHVPAIRQATVRVRTPPRRLLRSSSGSVRLLGSCHWR